MIWWLLLSVIIGFVAFFVKKRDENVVLKCEVTFYCIHPRCKRDHRTITVRHYSKKTVQCKWCGTYYDVYADGTKLVKIDHYLHSSIIPERLSPNEIIVVGVDESFTNDLDNSWKEEIRAGDEVIVFAIHTRWAFDGVVEFLTDRKTAMVRDKVTMRAREIPLTDMIKDDKK